MYEIVIGRSEDEKKKLGLKGTVFLGKLYVKMGAVTSLSNEVYMDVARAHVVFVVGKRGSGKSYTLGVIAEEMANLPKEIADRLAVLIIDTMGIYWTMKYPNEKDEDLLREWGLEKKSLDIKIYTPVGYFKEQKEKGIPVDYPFTIRPVELFSEDWVGLFGIDLLEPAGVLIDRTITKLKKEKENFSIDEIVEAIKADKRIDEKTKLAVENRFISTKGWGLFSKEGTPLKEIITGGKTTVLDVSIYKEWTIKCLVLGIIGKKLMQERMITRKAEELESVKTGYAYFKTTIPKAKKEMPIVWILIDEGHSFLPLKGKTLATDALVTILREGRQPGVCLAIASQQPGVIHRDVITQSDIVISHRLTARKDIDALNAIMQTYAAGDIQKFLNALPALKGSAVVLDDNSEKLYNIRVRPRFTWHGGEAPTAVKPKGRALEELGL